MTPSQLGSIPHYRGTQMYKLWLVEFRNAYDAFEYSGVFSTEEKAKEYVQRFKHEKNYFEISEVTVDEP